MKTFAELITELQQVENYFLDLDYFNSVNQFRQKKEIYETLLQKYYQLKTKYRTEEFDVQHGREKDVMEFLNEFERFWDEYNELREAGNSQLRRAPKPHQNDKEVIESAEQKQPKLLSFFIPFAIRTEDLDDNNYFVRKDIRKKIINKFLRYQPIFAIKNQAFEYKDDDYTIRQYGNYLIAIYKKGHLGSGKSKVKVGQVIYKLDSESDSDKSETGDDTGPKVKDFVAIKNIKLYLSEEQSKEAAHEIAELEAQRQLVGHGTFSAAKKVESSEAAKKKKKESIAMKLAPGQCPLKFKDTYWRLTSASRKLRIFNNMANEVAKLHSAGKIHRDIKPRNFVLDTRNDQVRLVDLATQFSTGQTLTMKMGANEPRPRVGTRAYLPPEIQSGDGPAVFSNKSDVFSLGLTYASLLDFLPCDLEQETSPKDLLPFEEIRSRVPPILPLSILEDFYNLVKAMVANDPEKRPDINSVMEKLQELSDRVAEIPKIAVINYKALNLSKAQKESLMMYDDIKIEIPHYLTHKEWCDIREKMQDLQKSGIKISGFAIIPTVKFVLTENINKLFCLLKSPFKAPRKEGKAEEGQTIEVSNNFTYLTNDNPNRHISAEEQLKMLGRNIHVSHWWEVKKVTQSQFISVMSDLFAIEKRLNEKLTVIKGKNDKNNVQRQIALIINARSLLSKYYNDGTLTNELTWQILHTTQNQIHNVNELTRTVMRLFHVNTLSSQTDHEIMHIKTQLQIDPAGNKVQEPRSANNKIKS